MRSPVQIWLAAPKLRKPRVFGVLTFSYENSDRIPERKNSSKGRGEFMAKNNSAPNALDFQRLLFVC